MKTLFLHYQKTEDTQNLVNENLTSFYKITKQSATNTTAYVLLVFSFQKEGEVEEEEKKYKISVVHQAFFISFPS
jgi:hypothetical protein